MRTTRVAEPTANSQQVYAGPRPTNTLSRRTQISRQTGRLNALGGSESQLETTTSIGYNVRYGTLEHSSDSFHRGEPHHKRLKLEVQPNSQNTPQIVDGSDEADQIMRDDDVVQVKHINKVAGDDTSDKIKPVVSRGSSRPTDENAFTSPRQEEYRAIEKLMDSSLPKRKRRKRRHKDRNHDNPATEASLSTSSKSESIEILDSELTTDPIVKVAYKGTANLLPSRRYHTASKPNLGRSTADRSPYFQIPTPQGLVQPKEQSVKVEGRPSATEARLRDKYRDSNGRQRGDADSADELLVAEPNTGTLSPVKSTRSQSPTKISQSVRTRRLSIEDELAGPRPAQSIIKPSVFTKVANNGARSKVRTNQGNYPGEKPAPWDLELHAYNFQGRTHKHNSLALVYNESEKSYDIHESGVNLARHSPDLRIRPNKLHKIRWAFEGTKMRFQSSKTVDVDNVLDIELCEEKDIQRLTEALQGHGNFDVKGESRERMESVFERKLQGYHQPIKAGRSLESGPPEDVCLAGVRVERSDKKRASDSQHRPNSKRFRLVDAMFSDEKTDQDMKRLHDDHSANEFAKQRREITTGQEKLAAFNEDDLKPLDDKLKYALRSCNPSGLLSRRAKESSPFSFNEDIQDEQFQRYSKVHGLGKPWPKPLVYPNEGKKRTTVDFSDLERLDEGEFLNDSLIAFYLRYIERQAEQTDPTMARKVYMFNTFFYASLTKPGQRGINYEAVKKWTRGVDLFTYDFVIVPVNESAHWYVAIICNLPALNRKVGGINGDPTPGLGSPKEIEFEQSTRDKPITSSSPRTAASDEEPQDASPPAENAVEDPKEQATAASFAEMSLEADDTAMSTAKPSPEIPGDFHPNIAEQELLDHQLDLAANDVQNRDDSDTHEFRSADRKVDETVKTDKAASHRLRPGKRKSLASPRVFDPYKPTILTFDSFGTAHAQTVKVLKQYLREEANDKRGQMEFDEKELQGATAKQIPQQDNFCDCGLFLLGYMEKFFDNPREFIDKVMRRQWDVQKDWPKLDPSIMRANMRHLLMGLAESRRKEWEIARRAKANTKISKGPPSSLALSKDRSKPSTVDGSNEADTTPTKSISKAALPVSTSDAVLGPTENIHNPSEQVSASSREAASKPLRHIDDPIQQHSPSPKEAALDPTRHTNPPIQPPQHEPPLSRKAALTSALSIDESTPQQQQQQQEVSNADFEAANPEKKLAAEAHHSPPSATEEPSTQSFIVLDSQPESTNTSKHQEPNRDPESFAISPELPSTIQDSQPPLPEVPLEDFGNKEATPPPPKPKRHMDSFSSPLPSSKPTHAVNEPRQSPRTPHPPKRTYSPVSEQKSARESRTKRRPILGAKVPAITGTHPKVVINLDD
ncbi:MAG: hypothetical protein Q9171_006814 [Xanthocarpia ochracea]